MTGMTTFNEADHPRDSRSQRFVEKANSQPEGNLPAPEPLTITLDGTFTVDGPELFGPLPEYPTGLPEPQVSIDWDGGPRTTITVGDHTHTFWNSSNDEPHNSIVDLGLRGQFDNPSSDLDLDEQMHEFIDWGTEVHNRVETNVYSATLAAVSGHVEEAILSSATGRSREDFESSAARQILALPDEERIDAARTESRTFVLHALGADPSPDVRYAVAANPNTDVDLLEKLWDDSDSAVCSAAEFTLNS